MPRAGMLAATATIVLVFALASLPLISSDDKGGDGLVVVITFPGIEEDVKSILCGSDRVVVLVPAGVDPHEYTLKPSDVRVLEEADIVVTMGHTFLDKRVEDMASSGSLHAIVINVTSVPGVRTRIDPVTGRVNPHGVIYDPLNYARLLSFLAEKAASLNTPCGDKYLSSADQLIARLRALSNISVEGLRLVAETPLVQYAVEWSGARVVHVVSEPETPLSPSRLARAEELVSARAVDAIAVVDYGGEYSRIGTVLVELAERHDIPVIRVPSLFLNGSLIDKLEYIMTQLTSIRGGAG